MKIIFYIEDKNNQGDYFQLFMYITLSVCIISQLPNIYSLGKTFGAVLESSKNQNYPDGEDDLILLNQGGDSIAQALKFSDLRVSSTCVDQPEYSKLQNQMYFCLVKLILQDSLLNALQIYYLHSYK